MESSHQPVGRSSPNIACWRKCVRWCCGRYMQRSQIRNIQWTARMQSWYRYLTSRCLSCHAFTQLLIRCLFGPWLTDCTVLSRLLRLIHCCLARCLSPTVWLNVPHPAFPNHLTPLEHSPPTGALTAHWSTHHVTGVLTTSPVYSPCHCCRMRSWQRPE